MIRSATIASFGPIGLVQEIDEAIPGYSSIMTVHGMTPEPAAAFEAAVEPDTRPVYVVTSQHGRYLDFLHCHGFDHLKSRRVTRPHQIEGLSKARIFTLPGWMNLPDSAQILDTMVMLKALPGISIEHE